MVSASRNSEVVKLRTSTLIGLFKGVSTVKNVNKYTVCGFLPSWEEKGVLQRWNVFIHLRQHYLPLCPHKQGTYTSHSQIPTHESPEKGLVHNVKSLTVNLS
jgi:hypothetical protein